jgi:hypothetical protein
VNFNNVRQKKEKQFTYSIVKSMISTDFIGDIEKLDGFCIFCRYDEEAGRSFEGFDIRG